MVNAKTIKAAAIFVVILFALSFQSLYSVVSILNKSCFLSFEQNDWNGAIVFPLKECISAGIISIVVPQLLKEAFKQDPHFQEDCKSGKIALFASTFKTAGNDVPHLIVIIPESLEQLGLKISAEEKQKVALEVGISSVETKYGFKNLELINPEFVAATVDSAKAFDETEIKNVLSNFPNIINISLPQHPTRFYLAGHGVVGFSIAGVPINYFDFLLADFSAINTEFIYIYTCYAFGNISRIQRGVEDIVTKQIEERKKSKAAPFPGIDYAIVIQSTADVQTFGGVGNVKLMLTKLDKFLEKPVWALEFGPGVKKPKITISDVVAALGTLETGKSSAMPSIRMPGRNNFFRPIKVDSVEIITASKLIELGVEKASKLVEESESADKNSAQEAKKKLAGPLGIEIFIKPDISFVQIFPIDLFDFTFVFPEGSPAQFISKLSGQGQHYIGSVVDDTFSYIENFISDRFINIFTLSPYKAERCWFIKSVDLPFSKTHIKKLVIRLFGHENEKEQFYGYVYINEKGEYVLGTSGAQEHKMSKRSFEATIRSWFKRTIPSHETLKEAIGSAAVTTEEKAQLEKTAGGAQTVKLLERFARTPQDLFNMFMAD